MGEREVITAKIAEIKAAQEMEQAALFAREAEAARKEQEKADRVARLKGLAPRFVSWVLSNDIKPDIGGILTSTYDVRSRREKFRDAPPRIRTYATHTFTAWHIAYRTEERWARVTSGKEDARREYVNVPLIVCENGILYNSYKRVCEDEEIAEFTTEQVYARIAQLSLANNVEWDYDE